MSSSERSAVDFCLNSLDIPADQFSHLVTRDVDKPKDMLLLRAHGGRGEMHCAGLKVSYQQNRQVCWSRHWLALKCPSFQV